MCDLSHLPDWWRWYVYIPLPQSAVSFEHEVHQALKFVEKFLDPKTKSLSVARYARGELPGFEKFVYKDFKSIPSVDTGDYGLILKIYIRPGSCGKSDNKGRKKVLDEAVKTLETTLKSPVHRRAGNIIHNYAEHYPEQKDMGNDLTRNELASPT